MSTDSTRIFDVFPHVAMGSVVNVRGRVFDQKEGAQVTLESGASALTFYPTAEACDQLAAHFSELAYRTRRANLKSAA